MQFINPLYLIALASAAIPLIIHLSRSRRTRKMRFSTTRFLTEQFLRSYRMSRLKELLLLAARMALCALFALALAQPFIKPGTGSGLLFGKQRRSVVLVVDNSASMGYREQDRTLLGRAKQGARDVLDTLRDGDQASIVLTARQAGGPEILFKELTPDLGDLRQALDSIQSRAMGTDLSGAVRRAEEVVARKSADTSREIYVFSDLQDTGWELNDEQQTPSGVGDTNYFLVSVRAAKPRNLAVTAVQYAAARPMVGIPFAIRPHVLNQSDRVAACEIELVIDGKKVGQRRVSGVQAGRWATPSFFHTFAAGGWHSGYVQVKDDRLEADNRRYFAFEVLDSLKVLVVNGAPSAIKRLDELFFLNAALGASATGKSPIQVDVIRPDEIGRVDLKPYPLITLANVESMPQQSADRLQTYVDQGGGLLMFLGDKINPGFYNRVMAGADRLHGGLLPGPLRGIRGDPSAPETTLGIGDFDRSHVALAAFEAGDAGSLRSVQLKAFWEIDPGDARVLITTRDKHPLLCERSFGAGRVILCTTTCDRDWTNLPVRPVYLPLMYRLVGYLAQEPLSRRNFFHTGDSIALPVAATEGTRQRIVKKPDGSVGSVQIGGGAAPLEFDDTQEPGIYRVYTPQREEQAQLFAVNLEAYESDMTLLDDVLAARGSAAAEAPGDAQRTARIEAGIQSDLLPGRMLVSFLSDPQGVTEAAAGAQRGLRLWDVALFIALIVALIEPWLANRISLLRYFRRTTAEERPAHAGGVGEAHPTPVAAPAGRPVSRELQEAN